MGKIKQQPKKFKNWQPVFHLNRCLSKILSEHGEFVSDFENSIRIQERESHQA